MEWLRNQHFWKQNLYISHISWPYSYILINSYIAEGKYLNLSDFSGQNRKLQDLNIRMWIRIPRRALMQVWGLACSDDAHWTQGCVQGDGGMEGCIGKMKAPQAVWSWAGWERAAGRSASISRSLAVSQSTDPSPDCETLLTELDGRDLSPGTDLNRIKHQHSGDGQSVEWDTLSYTKTHTYRGREKGTDCLYYWRNVREQSVLLFKFAEIVQGL